MEHRRRTGSEGSADGPTSHAHHGNSSGLGLPPRFGRSTPRSKGGPSSWCRPRQRVLLLALVVGATLVLTTQNLLVLVRKVNPSCPPAEPPAQALTRIPLPQPPVCQLDTDFEEDVAWLTQSFPVTDKRLGECYAPVFSELRDGVFTITDCPPEQKPHYVFDEDIRYPYTAPVQLPPAVETVRGFCEHPTLGEVHDMHHRLSGLEVPSVVARSKRIRQPAPEEEDGGAAGISTHDTPSSRRRRTRQRTSSDASGSARTARKERAARKLDGLRGPAGGRAPLGELADLNVVLVIMDAVSRLQFLRSMPATMRLFSRLNNGREAAVFDMEMYGVTGWHSLENQLPLLLGHDCNGESHSAFYDYKAAEESDTFSCDSVIWPFFKSRGYATAQFGDQCNYSRKKFPGNEFLELKCMDVLTAKCGLDEPLMDLKDPLLLECLWYDRIRNATFAGVENSLLCINSTALLTLAEQALNNYAGTGVPVMATVLTSVGHNSHQAGRLQPVADKPMVKFLSSIDLTNTAVVILSDHGLHYGPHLRSEQGQFEHRNPSLRVIMPRRVLDKYPDMYQALLVNQHRVISPWDMHLTLKHLTTYPNPPPRVPAAHISRSLLTALPANRTCAEAGIPPSTCLCTVWAPVPVHGAGPYPDYKPEEHDGHSAEDLRALAGALLDDHINHPLDRFGKSDCMRVHLDSFRVVARNRFRELDHLRISIKFYLKLEFTAQPGDLIFSGTIVRRYDKDEDLDYQAGIGLQGIPDYVAPELGDGVAYRTQTFHRLSSMNLPEHLVPSDAMPVEFAHNRQFCVVR